MVSINTILDSDLNNHCCYEIYLKHDEKLLQMW